MDGVGFGDLREGVSHYVGLARSVADDVVVSLEGFEPTGLSAGDTFLGLKELEGGVVSDDGEGPSFQDVMSALGDGNREESSRRCGNCCCVFFRRHFR